MNRNQFNRIVNLLTPFMDDVDDRRARITLALFGCSALSQISWGGNKSAFTVNLINTLHAHGDAIRARRRLSRC